MARSSTAPQRFGGRNKRYPEGEKEEGTEIWPSHVHTSVLPTSPPLNTGVLLMLTQHSQGHVVGPEGSEPSRRILHHSLQPPGIDPGLQDPRAPRVQLILACGLLSAPLTRCRGLPSQTQ